MDKTQKEKMRWTQLTCGFIIYIILQWISFKIWITLNQENGDLSPLLPSKQGNSALNIFSHLNCMYFFFDFNNFLIYVQVNLCQKLFFLQNMGRTCCVQKLFWMSETISVCTQHVLPRFELKIFMYWTCNSMNNLSWYCGLVDTPVL